MLCKNCYCRYADFPEEDFKFILPHGKIKAFFSIITFNLIKRNGIYVRNQNADSNRMKAFNSDNGGFCSEECIDDFERKVRAKAFMELKNKK